MEKHVRGGYVAESFAGGQGKAMQEQTEEQSKQEGQSSQTASPRFCRKCFLREMELQGGLKASYQNMLERIEMMDPDLRCTGEVYEARLLQCKKCEYLAEGMCGLCGCFAESRAAVKANACPANPRRWEAMQEESEEK
ncbi:MAG: hypothetical protein IJZ55_04405 [Lachnospiraceae bacterium]|nr:hypothetical protein [Lachnospiraceae bacterium]